MKYRYLFVSVVFFVLSVTASAEIVSDQPMIPVLIDRDDNMVLRISIDGPGQLEAMSISATGTTEIKDIEAATLYYAGEKQPKGISPSYKKLSVVQDVSKKFKFAVSQELAEGKNYFVVSYDLASDADILHKVRARCSSVTIDGKLSRLVEKGNRPLNLGIKVRHYGDDNSKGYRIPAMVTTNKGSLLAAYDVRWDSKRDLQGDMDIGLSRSTNGGQTWESMRIALDMKEFGSLPQKYNGVSDASLLVDRKTGRVFVFGCWMYGLRNKDGSFRTGLTKDSKDWAHQWHKGYVGSGPGMTPKETAQFIMAYSDDDGKRWSQPVNITSSVKRDPAWCLFAPAPGNGITLSDGTLVLPTQGRDKDQKVFSNIIFSKDRGKTWQASESFYSGTNECAIVELSDESIMLNGRHSDARSGTRGVAITSDLGKTWKDHLTSFKALIEPTCMASLIKHTKKLNDKDVLFFSNPNSKKGRHHLTIKTSFDDGMSWPKLKQLLIDELGGAYSCLTSVDDNTVGIFYESSQGDLIFQKFLIDTIVKSL